MQTYLGQDDILSALSNSNHYVQGSKSWSNILSLFVMLSSEHKSILESLANHTCQIPNRSLLEEVEAYSNHRHDVLQKELDVTKAMLQDTKYENISAELMNKQLNIKIS